MAKRDKEVRPIIKKVIVEEHGGHHGGAWKVAYADFVTAMMAFFLLLWILSSAQEETLEGIAEHFSPNVVETQMTGGMGPLEGSSIAPEGTASASDAPFPQTSVPDFGESDPLAKGRNEAEPEKVVEYVSEGQMMNELEKALRKKDEESFKELEQKIVQAMQEVPDLKDLIPNVIFDETEEGLRIQIIDQEGKSMFASGSAKISERTKALMSLVGSAIAQLPNEVIVSGHTDATPFANEDAEVGYGNWELSADRANAVRRIFLNSDVDNARFRRVAGLADREPFKPEDPRHASNRRISVVLAYAKAPKPNLDGGGSTSHDDAGYRGEEPDDHEKFDTGSGWDYPKGYKPPKRSEGNTLTIEDLEKLIKE